MGRKIITEDHGWAVWSPYQGPFTWSIASTRAEAIKAFQDSVGGDWQKWKREGFRAVRVTVRAHQAYLPKGG